jgi:hypothetical protein
LLREEKHMTAVLDRKGNEIKIGSMVKSKGSSILRMVSAIHYNSGPSMDAVVLKAHRIDKTEWTFLVPRNAEVVS